MNAEAARGEDRKGVALSSDVVTVPNVLSIFRILLVPVFLWSIIHGKTLEALLIFFLAGLTDLLDGLIARALHQRTKLGTVLDPAGDKLLMAVSYVVLTLPALARPNAIPIWLTIFVFSRDILIVAGALVAYLTWRQKTFTPSFLGKITTAFQVGTVFLVLFLNYLRTAPWFMPPLYILTLAVTIASGTHYFFFGLSALKRRKP
jgi:cardiolipin synthase